MKGGTETKKARLAEVLPEIWDKIDEREFWKLVCSVPRRIQAIIDAQGWYTRQRPSVATWAVLVGPRGSAVDKDFAERALHLYVMVWQSHDEEPSTRLSALKSAAYLFVATGLDADAAFTSVPGSTANAMILVDSSYIPTLKALFHGIASEPAAHPAPSGRSRILLVEMDETPGMAPLSPVSSMKSDDSQNPRSATRGTSSPKGAMATNHPSTGQPQQPCSPTRSSTLPATAFPMNMIPSWSVTLPPARIPPHHQGSEFFVIL
ncbi:hypothetical protein DFH27DRAFT_609877 [Peziza echinospora]|nr:hypothetical protein DFH27DRAFT_609877 [Peziza echinospora]